MREEWFYFSKIVCKMVLLLKICVKNGYFALNLREKGFIALNLREKWCIALNLREKNGFIVLNLCEEWIYCSKSA